MQYDNDTCNQFVTDMEDAGYEVEHYQGRAYWEGPAVRAKHYGDTQGIIRATNVQLQRDNMGTGSIIYPVRGGKLVEAADIILADAMKKGKKP